MMPVSPIQKAAADALAARREQDAQASRGVLAAFLGADAAKGLRLADGDGLVVFTDGTVSLSVDADGGVRLVELVDEQWTSRSEALPDLVALGEALEAQAAG